jgi:hypothetical protein
LAWPVTAAIFLFLLYRRRWREAARWGAGVGAVAVGGYLLALWREPLMLEHLGHADAAAAVVGAIERVLADPSAPRTPDIGGKATTVDVGRAIAATL